MQWIQFDWGKQKSLVFASPSIFHEMVGEVMAWWSRNKIVGILVSAMLALEAVYKINPPEPEKIVMIDPVTRSEQDDD